MRPPAGVNFTALASRFQSTCRRRAASPATSPIVAVDRHLQRDRLRIGGGTDGFDRAADEIAEIDGRDVQAEVAGGHRRQIEQLLDDLHLRGGVAFDGVEDRRRALGRNRSSRSMRVQPSTALSGVRSSWESIARNSSLTRLACSRSRISCARSCGQRALVILEQPSRGDVHHRAGREARRAVVVEHDPAAILQPADLAIVRGRSGTRGCIRRVRRPHVDRAS